MKPSEVELVVSTENPEVLLQVRMLIPYQKNYFYYRFLVISTF